MRYVCGRCVPLPFVMPTLVQRPSAGSTTAKAPRRRRVPWLKILLAALAALLLQAVLIVLLAWALPHWPRPPLKKGSAPISLVIQPPEPAETPSLHKTEVVPSEQHPEYMRTTDENKADTPPPDPNFISDKDTKASAEKAAEDPFKPLPTQDGKEFDAYDFTTNPYIPGKEAHDNDSAAAPAASASAPTPPPEDAKENPTPPSEQSTPSPNALLTLRPSASPSNTPPAPSPSPATKPHSTPPPVQDLLAQQAAKVARENSTVSSHSIPQAPGFQPQSVQTKMSGSVKDLGKNSVSALGTPLGRYEKAISDAIASRWYQLVNDRMSDLVRTESVQIHFFVTRNGQSVSIRASGAKKDTILASISIQAINESELPPIPADVASKLPEGQLEVDYTFGMFEQ